MFTKPQLTQFRVDFSSAVKALESKYGIKVELGSITYNDVEFHCKMTCTKVDASSGQKQVNAREFDMLKRVLGFDGNLGDKFISNGAIHTVTGLDGGKPKYPVLTECNGKKFKTTIDGANMMLKLHRVS